MTVLLGAVSAGPLLLYGLSASSDSLIVDLGITEAQFGLLATACFTCAAIGNATLGRMADRHSDTSLMTAIFALAAAALLLVGIPAGFGVLVLAAAFSGVSQSFTNGVTNRILLDRVPDSKRIGWVGIKQSGVQVSQLVASVVFPLLAGIAGWRGASLVLALIPLVLMVMSWHALRVTPMLPGAAEPPVDDEAAGSDAETVGSDEAVAAGSDEAVDTAETTDDPTEATVASSATDVVAEAARTRSPRYPMMVWALGLFGLLNGIAVQATNVYMPLFSVRELGFPLVLGGATAALAGAVGVAARVGWARQMARGASGPHVLLLLALIALVGAGMFSVAGLTGWAWPLWLAAALHGASALGVSVVLMSALMRSIPSASMASASGMVTAGMFAGFAAGPLIMGLIVSSSGGFLLGWAVVGLIYLLCAALAVVLMRAAGKTR
ncbi:MULTISPECIES: MFS transporter [unclassified Brevibacterium]|uniref:MFS transporter n=1 Tax=unclassified Brevibacterium TaxID=2614124 RepID=UPI001E5542EB|nr:MULTISPECIES: MFS transporter [unclassified Brevibacterium]MDK8434563.1 MFS transporter [Brevibacterium sp. H-BE7]